MKQKKLILLGGGGHCKSVIDVAESAGFNILGVLDMPENVGKPILDYEVIGTDDDIPRYVNTAEFVITVGFIKNSAIRIKIYDKVKNAGGKFATIVASTAYVSKYAILGEGTVIMHQAVVNAEAKVGINCIINTKANIDHGAIIGDFTHLSVGVLIAGEAKVGDRCFCGIGSTIQHLTTITSDVILGAATLVVKDITNSGIYVGIPAKFLKKV
mgnify:FL=1